MKLLEALINLFHHFRALVRSVTHPDSLNAMAGSMGGWLYALLFVIVFCETGLVVTPFLPGDSMLFAVGALGALPQSPINLWLMGGLLFLAAVLGDAANYAIGKRLGPTVFHSEKSRWLNKEHLQAAHALYEKHGGKIIILVRFMPIFRTFAPFVAGMAKMNYRYFALYNITGAFLWVGLLMGAGRLFGGLPIVQKHFESVIFAIILISALPAVVEFFKSRMKKRQ